MSPDPNCKLCGGEGWVCEDHADKPWVNGNECCGGAGMPCECNPLHPKFKQPPVYDTRTST
jgi:hypothetical protein